MAFEITSSAFNNQDSIPARYTADGADLSPPLRWTDPPEGTQSFALICDDPDAPTPDAWVHWVVYDIPPEIHELSQGIKTEEVLDNGAKHGSNSWRRYGYGGPAPPSGTHRYYFKLYALDTMLNLEPGATKDQLLEAMRGHTLAEAQMMGTYHR